jgi:hypothetical protein
VIGPDLVVLDLLRASLSCHFEATSDNATRNDDEDGDRRRSDAVFSRLRVSNRYFVASVGLYGLHDPLQDANTHREDGVLLVLPHPQSGDISTSSSSALDTLAALHGDAEAQGKAGDLLRLCVVVVRTIPAQVQERKEAADRIDDSKANEEDEYSRRILWCLDRGYEYVEVDLSEDGVLRGHDDRDKEGFARVVEAIQTTVWSSAVMRLKQRQELSANYEQVKQKVIPAEHPPPLREPEPATATTPDPVATPPESDSEQEERARQALLLQAIEEREGLEGGGGEPANGNHPDNEATLVHSEMRQQEQYYEQFEGALQEAARIREMSRSGALSDEDRKRRAGDAALLLMDLMGKLGSGGLLEDSDADESDPEEPDYDKATELTDCETHTE